MGAPSIPPFVPLPTSVIGASICLLGDSISAIGGQPYTTTSGPTPDNCFFNWAQIFMGQALMLLNNGGKTADTTSMMYARLAADVLAYKPKMCHFLGGINDIISHGGTVATVTAQLTLIFNKINLAGILLLAGTIMPYNATGYAANTVTAAFWTGGGTNAITVATNTNHGVAVGQTFTLTNMVPIAYNGTYVALSGTANTILIAAKTSNPGTYSSGGNLLDQLTNINAIIQGVNDWIRAWCWANPTTRLIDYHAAMVNPTSSMGVSQTLYIRASDNLHPSPLGARVAGQLFANVVNPIITSAAHHVVSANAVPANGVSSQILANPLCVGTSGTKYNGGASGSSVTGTVTTDWTCGISATQGGTSTMSVVCSTGTDANGVGNSQILTVTSQSASDVALIQPGSLTDMIPYIAAGNYVQAEIFVALSSMANVKGIDFKLYLDQTGGSQVIAAETMSAQAASVGEYSQSNWSGFIRTPVVKIPSVSFLYFVLNLTISFFGGGTCTIAASRAAVWNYGSTQPTWLTPLPDSSLS